MKGNLSRLQVMAAVIAALAFADGARAEGLDAEVGASVVNDSAETATEPLLAGRALDEEALAGWRGGADAHYNDMRETGTVREVSVSDAVTGHNLITEGALAGASGMPMIVQNSGNGVLIQNAVIVNIELN